MLRGGGPPGDALWRQEPGAVTAALPRAGWEGGGVGEGGSVDRSKKERFAGKREKP